MFYFILAYLCPYKELNLDLNLRRVALYPLSYRDKLYQTSSKAPKIAISPIR
ncbi:MAG: hypothetical protein UU81_C0016G0014 [Microgenomates group bacterium GW2011_GWC1_41_8]|nr:MAG: hypothetical protein UU81_C0016G0014 [Microgenomates group bacterium GW2011_GWC1_41_8]